MKTQQHTPGHWRIRVAYMPKEKFPWVVKNDFGKSVSYRYCKLSD